MKLVRRPALAHEAVDAEYQRHPGNRDRRGTTDSVAASVMNPAPVTPAAPFELSMATASKSISSPNERWMPVACAMNSAASDHVDVGPVEIERIAGGHDEPDDLLGAAGALHLLKQAWQGGFR